MINSISINKDLYSINQLEKANEANWLKVFIKMKKIVLKACIGQHVCVGRLRQIEEEEEKIDTKDSCVSFVSILHFVQKQKKNH